MAYKNPPPPKEIPPDLLNKCTCNLFQWPEHPCPYEEEFFRVKNNKCTCCPFCTRKCQDDI